MFPSLIEIGPKTAE